MSALDRLQTTLAAIDALEAGSVRLDLNSGTGSGIQIIRQAAITNTPVASIDLALESLELYLSSLNKMRVVPTSTPFTVEHAELPYAMTPTTITKLGEDGWSAVVNISPTIAGDGYVEFKLPALDKDVRIGLGPDHQIRMTNSSFSFWEGSTLVSVATPTSPTTTQLIEIERIGSEIKYYVNSIAIRTSNLPSAGSITATANIFHKGALITDLKALASAKAR